jgi:hypothetical protein
MYGGEPKIRSVATPISSASFQYSMTGRGEWGLAGIVVALVSHDLRASF